MTADPVSDDVLSRFADTWAAKTRGGSTPTQALVEVLFGLDLAIVPRAQTVHDDAPVTHGPAVTLAALFDKAAKLVDQHQHDQAAVLLDVIDTYGGHPVLAAYRALVDVLAELDRAGCGMDETVWAVEAHIRARVLDHLNGKGP